MPRKKQASITQSSANSEPCLKATPMRKSCRKTVVKSKSSEDKSQVNDVSIESPKVPLKKKKVKEIPKHNKSEGNSPQSTDSGISSETSIKNESILPSPTKYENKTILNKSYSSVKSNSSLINNTNILDSKTIDKNSKTQKKYKRKTSDLIESDQISDSKIKHNVKKKLKNAEPNKELNVKFEKVSKIKQEMSFPSGSDTNISSMKEVDSVLQVLTQHEFKSESDVKTLKSKKTKTKDSSDDSCSDSDWEEVEERNEQNLEDYNPVIPKEGVEITIDCPELNVRKRKKKQFDEMEYIRLFVNRELKEQQLNTHKTHLLCLLAHGLFINNLLNSPNLKATALSLLPSDILSVTSGRKIDKIDVLGIKSIVSRFQDSFSFENEQLPFINIKKNLINYFHNQKSLNASEYNLMFIVVARILGFKTRFCVSFYPLTHKAKHLFKKNGNKKIKSIKVVGASLKDDVEEKSKDVVLQNIEKKSVKKACKKGITKTQKNEIDDPPKKSKSLPKRSTEKSYKMSSGESDNDDEDFDVVKEKKIKQTQKTSSKKPAKRSNRNVLSSDSEPASPESCNVKLDNIVCWCEVFSKSNKRWIPIECSNNITDEPYKIEELLPKPVTYIVAYDNESYIKDVTRRYCSDYMTSTLKMRADNDWWEETLEPFSPPNSKQDKDEEKKLEDLLINKPLPKTVSEFKNHPLYALKRHLLKFEGIYPPDAAPVGFLREEPIYARDCVCKLHSRETWVKEARVVRAGEEPYKIVKARPKWDRIAGVMRTDLPLEIFGFWQTDPYEPPTAVDGKVPRNEYGNVELFKPCMLPKGTVHLQIPGLNRVAKKLGIDCSPAVVGFDGHKGSIHPVYDGFVVCKEYKETLLAAWDEEQENARKREEEKREKRIYGNWKKLIRGLLIRERIKIKYDVN